MNQSKFCPINNNKFPLGITETYYDDKKKSDSSTDSKVPPSCPSYASYYVKLSNNTIHYCCDTSTCKGGKYKVTPVCEYNTVWDSGKKWCKETNCFKFGVANRTNPSTCPTGSSMDADLNKCCNSSTKP
uniref:Uncharacterized protein n=1 Tax=viral metagenome TaxID=1070528 RepID=A0A6C0D0D0_9ZZZZ